MSNQEPSFSPADSDFSFFVPYVVVTGATDGIGKAYAEDVSFSETWKLPLLSDFEPQTTQGCRITQERVGKHLWKIYLCLQPV